MTIKEANTAGIIVEILTNQNIPTGNVYKLCGVTREFDGKIPGWKQYRQGKCFLHPNVRCRILDNRPFHGQYDHFKGITL